jgi:type IV pilus assembly protein PilY1
MSAYSGSSPPDKDSLVRWIRGEDNYGDEKGPGGTVTVRPSIHGDVLHSRPVVVNYGDDRGIVVFYGANDGVFRAINGNKTDAIGTVPAGGELWGLVFPEHFNDLNRLRVNSPELKFPTTTLAGAQPKDYFADGPTGLYQKLDADGKIEKAYLYVTMRRGGRFMYAIDVTQPATPTVLWKIDSNTSGFSELGQTWSRPRITVMRASTDPVLVFGAGYDAEEDVEPPGTASSGRGIFVVNALTGALIWSATPGCTTSATCLNVPGMAYPVPSEITFVDRNEDGKTDKFYFGDTGGNLWRADVNNTDTASWTVTKLAALGCDSGVCSSGTTPRKFLFPPAVITVKPAGSTGSYDIVTATSGDREHPLKNTTSGSAYGVTNRFFLIEDTGTAVDTPATSGVVLGDLFNATSTAYTKDGTTKGFYITLATGEKGVNATSVLDGIVYFGTNRPIDRSATCAPNLGEAKAYAVDPFSAATNTNVLAGGGMPPTAVSGVMIIRNGNSTEYEKFCLGCGVLPPGSDNGGGDGDGSGGGNDCESGIGNCPGSGTIPKNLRRTYWYKK